jgi:hypothetical protein
LRHQQSIPDLAIEKAEAAYRLMITLKAALSKFQADADLRFHCYKNLTISEAFRSKLIDSIDLLAIDLGSQTFLTKLPYVEKYPRLLGKSLGYFARVLECKSTVRLA